MLISATGAYRTYIRQVDIFGYPPFFHFTVVLRLLAKAVIITEGVLCAAMIAVFVRVLF